MAGDFDPYYKWLAIPPSEQPPNLYRLLGVPLYTDDQDVIDNAADQRMAHLRSYQAGRYEQESQQLLNEVASARVILLNGGKKADYDNRVRRELQPAAVAAIKPVVAQPLPIPQAIMPAAVPLRPLMVQQVITPPPVPPPVPPLLAGLPRSNSTADNRTPPPLRNRPTKPKASKSVVLEIAKHIAASVAGLLCGYLIVGFFAPSWDHFGLFHGQPSSANQSPVRIPNVVPVAKPDRPESPSQPDAQAKIPAAPPIRPNEPPLKPPAINTTLPKPPEIPVEPKPTVEELARRAEEEKQQRLTRLQTDRDAATAAGQVDQALKLTAELAPLTDLDPRAEKLRVINELRQVELPPAETVVLTNALLEEARYSLEHDRQELAVEQATAALQLARKTTDNDLIRRATQLILDVQK